MIEYSEKEREFILPKATAIISMFAGVSDELSLKTMVLLTMSLAQSMREKGDNDPFSKMQEYIDQEVKFYKEKND